MRRHRNASTPWLHFIISRHNSGTKVLLTKLAPPCVSVVSSHKDLQTPASGNIIIFPSSVPTPTSRNMSIFVSNPSHDLHSPWCHRPLHVRLRVGEHNFFLPAFAPHVLRHTSDLIPGTATLSKTSLSSI